MSVMRKALVILFITICSIAHSFGQHINVGISGGLPVGEASDKATFGFSTDFSYLFVISETFRVGGSTGYTHFFGDDANFNGFTIEIDDQQFIPLAASLRVDLPADLTIGGDMGFALGLNSGNDGGFYFSPRIQYQIFYPLDLVLAYRSFSRSGGDWSLFSLGIEFSFY